ncbi:chromatin assembly factor 1 subunit A-like isoform X1 [Acipenser ruthenus]|uniref:chromatin assembly factor 1 subunit A-like isoform X1 n=1 Tax=Acipenser ruthenus TaxID=7906 RepID=UPI00156180B1|nr:chromatin assembly factor 1 subunit A-like isoform X1 [Acipenser ruthenus]XP_058870001.1 chromatin assembly factor 1 subunit A-like isoform X1 [Acipenser ruthenus]
MECKAKSRAAAKKLVQARLPFKRLNPVPKENGESVELKKPRQHGPASAPKQHLDTSASDAENEHYPSLRLEAPSAVTLVNGRGPLDTFMSRGAGGKGKSVDTPCLTIDLTEDSNSTPCPGDHTAVRESELNQDKRESEVNQDSTQRESQLNQDSTQRESDLNQDSTQRDSKLNQDSTQREDSTQTGTLTNGAASPPADVAMDTSTADQSDCEMEMSENRSLDSSCSAGKEMTKTSSSKAERTPRAGPEPGEQHRKGVPEEGNPPRTESLDESRVTEAEETEEEEEELSPENDSLLSPSSVSSLSTAESSPEGCRSTGSRSASTPTHKPQTPKIKRTTEEKAKRRSLKDQEREDKRIKLQAEKEERERAREEAKAAKERAKEEAKKKREEEKEAREKEKREKREKEEREKAEKLLVKEEKRKEKQEALEAKQEEKRKKEEEKRLKEEKERVKAEKAEIRRFFQKPKTLQAPRTLAAACGKFAPFEIKENMTLAPLTRVLCDQEVLEQLDQYLQAPDRSANGLLEWKSRKPRRSGPTSPRTSDCVVLVEGSKPDGVPARQECGRMKLLHFCENYRPAYWGTWRKRSSKIKPRNPLSQDKELLDYEVDSDEEWEEEEPGESLSHSEGDDDDEGGGEAAGDDEDDDGFFVPHGYLSDGEGASEEESADPENQKVRQKLKAREWDELLSKGRVKVLQAVVLGCVWECEGPPGDTVLRTLRDYAVCVLDTRLGEEAGTPESMSKEKRDDHILSQMLPLLHGNVNGSKAIIREFQECWRGRAGLPSPPDSLAGSSEDSVPSKYRLKRLISESAVYEKRPALRRWCWYVHEAVLKRFSREELPVPCQWSYITQVPYAGREEAGTAGTGGGSTHSTPLSSSSSPAASGSAKRKQKGSMSITKFMRRSKGAEQQSEGMETDGFQADTEEDEDDPDCVIVQNTDSKQGCADSVQMEVASSSPSPAAPPCPSASRI